MRVPKRVKITVWKAKADVLPTGLNLVKRGAILKPKCGLCELRGEGACHMFLKCWFARCVWKGLGLERLLRVEGANFGEIWWEWFERLNRKEKTTVMIGIWILWQSRNQIVHNKGSYSVSSCIFKTKTMAHQFDTKMLLGIAELMEAVEDDVLVFCDGSWSKGENKALFGVTIIKNDVVLGCRAGGINVCASIEQAELVWAQVFGLSGVIVCSDSVLTVKALVIGSVTKVGFEMHLEEGSSILKIHPSWRVSHVFREINVIADGLAKLACGSGWRWEHPYAVPMVVSKFRKLYL